MYGGIRRPVVDTDTPDGTSRSTQAAVGGWNTRDPLSAMKSNEASMLDNYFPDVGVVRLRRGTAPWASGMVEPVESLLTYSSPTSNEMFAAADGAIYDVTASGVVGAAAVSGLTNDRWQSLNFGTGGTTYLIAVNGEDTPQRYNGSTWTTAGLTGVTSTQLVHINAFKSRLFFVEKDTMNVWYLAVNSISGALTKLSFAEMSVLGGYMMAMATWTRDGGSGIDDFAVFITSNGEAIIFQGTDPGTAADWAHVGTFTIGKPVGRRCFAKWGPDLVVITQDGFVPFSKVLGRDQTNSGEFLSSKIAPTVTDSVQRFGANFGWEATLYPKSGMLIFNVPVNENLQSDQYVLNTTTGAWCRFRNMNANTFAVLDGSLYFGTNDGRVMKADTGTGDENNTVDIVGECTGAYNYFGSPTLKKQFTMLRPLIRSDAPLGVFSIVNVDFLSVVPTATASVLADSFATWDDATWDDFDWAGDPIIVTAWQSVNGLGYAAAFRFRTSTKIQQVEWVATDWVFKRGGFV